MTTETTCSNCGQAVKPDWLVCPHCGQTHPARAGVIRCRVCGRRAQSNLHTCPQCGADLEPKPFPVIRVSLSAAAVIGLAFGLIQGWTIIAGGVQQIAMLVSSPTPTFTATATVAPTATQTPSPTLTPSPTATAIPPRTPTPTPTPTATPAPSPTSTPQPVPVVVDSPTPTPTSGFRYGKPTLIGPDEDRVYSRDEELMLHWEDMGPLGENEWYAVRLVWQQNGQAAYGGANVKENFWIVPPDLYWGLADQSTGRRYEWYVFIEEVTEDDNGQKVSRPVSEESDHTAFLWQ